MEEEKEVAVRQSRAGEMMRVVTAVRPRPCSDARPAAAPSSEEETRVPLLLLRPRPPQLPLTGPARPGLQEDDIYRTETTEQ